MTSPLASSKTLPCSAEMSRASSSVWRSTSSRKANMMRARRVSDTSPPGLEGVVRRAHRGVDVGRPRPAGPGPGARRSPGSRPATVRVGRAGGLVPPITCWTVFSAVVLTASSLPLGWSGRCAACACAPRRSGRAARVLSRPETSATGTSHQASELRRADERVGLRSWTTVQRSEARAVAQRRLQVLRPSSRDRHVGAEARRVGGEVDRQEVAVQRAGLRVAGAVVGAEALASRSDSESAPIEAKPWFWTSTTMSLMPSCTAVTISWAIIR